MNMSQNEPEEKKAFLHQHFLQEYIYNGNEQFLEYTEKNADPPLWKNWHYAIMIESVQPFFDTEKDTVQDDLQRALHRSFWYLNLNSHQSVLLFQEPYCDYTLIGKRIYVYLKQKHTERLYIAVSREFEDDRELPQIISLLEQQMEEQYVNPEVHVFTSAEEKERYVTEETQDSYLMQMISEDISRKDVGLLKRHFGCLTEKYQKRTAFSAVYIKFVFSSVLQELFQEERFSEERHLDREIDRIFSSSNMEQILEITRQVLKEYELFLEKSMHEARSRVYAVRDYIRAHAGEELTLAFLAAKVKLSPGYLYFTFKTETGMNLYRYIHTVRLEQAAQWLKETGDRIGLISERAGFFHPSYFCRAFEQYSGQTPQDVRRSAGSV